MTAAQSSSRWPKVSTPNRSACGPVSTTPDTPGWTASHAWAEASLAKKLITPQQRSAAGAAHGPSGAQQSPPAAVVSEPTNTTAPAGRHVRRGHGGERVRRPDPTQVVETDHVVVVQFRQRASDIDAGTSELSGVGCVARGGEAAQDFPVHRAGGRRDRGDAAAGHPDRQLRRVAGRVRGHRYLQWVVIRGRPPIVPPRRAPSGGTRPVPRRAGSGG